MMNAVVSQAAPRSRRMVVGDKRPLASRFRPVLRYADTRYLPGASGIRKRPSAEDCTRATSVRLGSRRIVIVARYGLSQTLPGRSTGHVGPIRTSPLIPESRSRVVEDAESRGNPCPPLLLANTEIDTRATAAARLHLLARNLRIMNSPKAGCRRSRPVALGLPTSPGHRYALTPRALRYGADTFITRVPQFLTPSGVWLDFGGTYSVASQIDFPLGSITAHE